MNVLTTSFSSPKILYGGLGFVLAVISGFVLSQVGRPLNSAIFTVHKLAALGTVILLGLGVRELYRTIAAPALHPAVMVTTALLFLALLVSGALLSFDNLAIPPVLRMHQIAPPLVLIFAAITIYLLMHSKA